jgi:hypothetical protein
VKIYDSGEPAGGTNRSIPWPTTRYGSAMGGGPHSDKTSRDLGPFTAEPSQVLVFWVGKQVGGESQIRPVGLTAKHRAALAIQPWPR